MNRRLEQLISLPIYILTFCIGGIAVWVHHSMVKEDYQVKKLKKASYKEIKEKMLNTKWRFDPNYPHSLFGENFYDNYFHAGIFRFGDVGYLLTLYGYIRVNILQRQIRKSIVGSNSSYGKPYVQ